jgi:tetratricopeptide (TPR) repeat protein
VSAPPLPAELPSAETALPQVQVAPIRNFSPWWIAAALIVLTSIAYWPTFSNGFVNYDDDGYVTQNHFVQKGLTLPGIVWAWRATVMANWHPLTWISHMADVQMFRMNPAGHHASSLLLHALNVALLFFLLYKATGFLWRSAMVAAAFAVHPLNVECVAWVSERKSLLCTTLLFLALFAYGWYCRKPGVARYLLVALLFALGLAAKPMVITLPFALLLLDYWPLERLPIPETAEARVMFWARFRRLALEKLPLLVLSAASAYITVIAQARTNTIAANMYLSLPVRLKNGLWSYLMYLVKAVWPFHLAIFYPHPENTLALWKPLLAFLLLLSFTAYCFLHLRQRYLLAGWLWYLGCLVPVIGVIQVGRQAMADRYAYTPLLGILVIVVWSVADHYAETVRRGEVLGLVSALALILLAALAWRQTGYWKDSFSLFQHALEVTPANFIAENNLGQAYVEMGRPDLAYDHFVRATEEKPHFGLAHYNLGVVLAGQNRNDEARKEFQMAIQYGQERPEVAQAYHNLGVVLLADRQWSEARALFSEAIRLTPEKRSSYLARGLTEFRLADYRAAESDFAAGASLSPDPNALFWLGRAQEKLGDLAGATDAYRKALSLQPGMPKAKERLDAIVSGRPLPFLQQDDD